MLISESQKILKKIELFTVMHAESQKDPKLCFFAFFI